MERIRQTQDIGDLFSANGALTARKELGAKITGQLSPNVVSVGNILHALPPVARREIEEHTVPPSAYEGRMPWISASYMHESPATVLMQESPFEAEVNVLSEVCGRLGINQPNIIVAGEFEHKGQQIKEILNANGIHDFFLHPFIGSKEIHGDYPTLPDASRFNDKGDMRQLTRGIGLPQNIIQGDEVMVHEGDTLETIVNRVDAAISKGEGHELRVKLGDTASGLCTIVLDTDHYHNIPSYRNIVLKEVDGFMRLNGDTELGNIVIEENLSEEKGWVDFGTRGYLLPDGTFQLTSYARQITDKDGVYMGSIVTSVDNPTSTGMSARHANEMKFVTERYAEAVYQMGYRGPINLDLFANIATGNGNVKSHDWNLRDGGTTAASLALMLSPNQTAMDLDLSLTTSIRLSDDEINDLITQAWEKENMIVYSSTFLRYPKVNDDGSLTYTLKTIALLDRDFTDEDSVNNEINSVSQKVSALGFGQCTFDRD